jgi:hypothetical protein
MASILQGKNDVFPTYPGYQGDPWTLEAWISSWYGIIEKMQDVIGNPPPPDFIRTSYVGLTWSRVPANKPVEYRFAWTMGALDYIETNFRPEVSVEEIHCVSSPLNPLGPVNEAAYIVLKGKMATVQLRVIRTPVTMDGLDMFGVLSNRYT